MQRMVYESFLEQCWDGVKTIAESDYLAARQLIMNKNELPPKDRTNSVVKKTAVDLLMRTKHASLQPILEKILGPCNPRPTFIANSKEYTYGYLSEGIHFPSKKHLYVRDDEPEDVKAFFLCLAKVFGLEGEVLDSKLISFATAPKTPTT